MENLLGIVLAVGGTALVLAVLIGVVLPLLYRTVVPTNKVHIVQSKKKTVSYGTGKETGNVYYSWPSWMPIIGVLRKELPVSNFDVSLKDYKAYDKERVPFELDVTAFMRIEDTNIAAERIENIDELKHQLLNIVQGSVRKILASHDINTIMTDRSKFGEEFTNEVRDELKNWGVGVVKNMELMDIRDSETSKVIANIMAKKSSHIEMESRVEVAKNSKEAETAEIQARQEVDLQKQMTLEAVGKRTAEQEKNVGIAKQLSAQDIKVEEAKTKEKEMAVKRVEQVKQAEIARDAAVVAADQQKQKTEIEAQGVLAATKLAADGVRATGEAKAEAERVMQMAPVSAQISLAKEIGQNVGYQHYLISIRQVEANEKIGVEQAHALQKADVKVIATTGNDVNAGVSSVSQLFTPKGGVAVGSMLEGLKNTPEGSALLEGVTKTLGGGSTANGK